MKENGTPIYVGVNFVLTPAISLSLDNRLKFQQQLEEMDINLTDISYDKQASTLVALRKSPMPLEVRMISPAQPVTQLLIIVPQIDGRSIDGVGREACDIAQAFSTVWPNRQIIQADATIRKLYPSSQEHAFQELWEGFLKQSSQSLTAFKRPVLGGGLRFVIPPISSEPALPQVDIKIESYLQDTQKIFIEVQCIWTQSQSSRLDPDTKLEQVDNFMQKELMDFISKGG
jgi:hypothetical protein